MPNQIIAFRKRKIIQHNDSMFICLPKIWCKQLSLDKGSSVSIYWDTEDNSLNINT